MVGTLGHIEIWFSEPGGIFRRKEPEFYNKIKGYKSPELYSISKFNDWRYRVGRQENSWENAFRANNLCLSNTFQFTEHIISTTPEKYKLPLFYKWRQCGFNSLPTPLSGQYADFCLPLLDFLLHLNTTQDSSRLASGLAALHESFPTWPSLLFSGSCWSPSHQSNW
jgi:hypothetical protein